jgi:hypothetical protein
MYDVQIKNELYLKTSLLIFFQKNKNIINYTVVMK